MTTCVNHETIFARGALGTVSFSSQVGAVGDGDLSRCRKPSEQCAFAAAVDDGGSERDLLHARPA